MKPTKPECEIHLLIAQAGELLRRARDIASEREVELRVYSSGALGEACGAVNTAERWAYMDVERGPC